MVGPQEILSFWLDETGPESWYKQSDALDSAIRTRFEKTWKGACEGRFSLWLTYPNGALAYIILMDQFSRNMFRDTEQAFASDRAALAAAKSAIDKGWDMRIDEPARQFFYLPLMHSENLCDQDRCVRLICERMPKCGAENLIHAQAHRAVIRQFGRFPTRNETLGRVHTTVEREFLARGGYGEMIRSLQAAKAA
ncbi:DUF924 domain-containing protein [Roseobacter sp. YSTF-M11]|uniref:DUF924 domain-containing protein n=1 Tax=Roseobacter insulae TaxID=2859783 RepID=A0A9X1FVK2_9RHOB|nr:DUF924 family protein [Roseobacter insulae]MBW4708564.1 DUF924 domain-containing protein [Roseobacter insulae]